MGPKSWIYYWSFWFSSSVATGLWIIRLFIIRSFKFLLSFRLRFWRFSLLDFGNQVYLLLFQRGFFSYLLPQLISTLIYQILYTHQSLRSRSKAIIMTWHMTAKSQDIEYIYITLLLQYNLTIRNTSCQILLFADI